MVSDLATCLVYAPCPVTHSNLTGEGLRPAPPALRQTVLPLPSLDLGSVPFAGARTARTRAPCTARARHTCTHPHGGPPQPWLKALPEPKALAALAQRQRQPLAQLLQAGVLEQVQLVEARVRARQPVLRAVRAVDLEALRPAEALRAGARGGRERHHG